MIRFRGAGGDVGFGLMQGTVDLAHVRLLPAQRRRSTLAISCATRLTFSPSCRRTCRLVPRDSGRYRTDTCFAVSEPLPSRYRRTPTLARFGRTVGQTEEVSRVFLIRQIRDLALLRTPTVSSSLCE